MGKIYGVLRERREAFYVHGLAFIVGIIGNGGTFPIDKKAERFSEVLVWTPPWSRARSPLVIDVNPLQANPGPEMFAVSALKSTSSVQVELLFTLTFYINLDVSMRSSFPLAAVCGLSATPTGSAAQATHASPLN